MLKQFNPFALLEDKDYVWTIDLKRYYEQAFYQWALELMNSTHLDEVIYVQALKYLLNYFPWQEPLISEVMPLILKLEGKGSLIHFYHIYEQNWIKLLSTELSQSIQNQYRLLIEN